MGTNDKKQAEISHKIEIKRNKMISVAAYNNLNLLHPDVLKISQELDVLLVTLLKKQIGKQHKRNSF
ncbi:MULTISPECIES: aspartyl-phosphate phosphatase Spo0E family protein [Aneurinibacillus]|uniref:Aspartyl-phosphate phosphatase Spo0E family protein n=1 Tax=Aneurinibacillus thermoaerophilus TaxID=143495 RepID=A0A1G8D4M7_ANETH|nr:MULTISPECIES: aspartyl-phosphate phosphatase Spo0E family protein [Aneurinibacillus]AMA74274.1 hypothetical protein ACH33_16645 [Aneurinibacillus sp. XH2]MED0675756.1 aspartyl-phosphate phosphatase Spo0E family protein [Aneurinibacillus thermoaerophilus]MED0680701.1 aspartyl-phosphate phosphatase Spo0E family protein [Aneurinibacillus thermoaerophilus]MED0736798.1 aspartyl-phosphate phosphatase Spo0E family protein [Aneurinibacillus thermoaerophilus]MED0758892.1 aspartyl-phosphate phosphata